MDSSTIKDWSQALVTPAILIVGAILTRFQLRLNAQKLKFDLFEKRYAIYEATRRFIISVMDGKPTQEAQDAFIAGTLGAQILFGEEAAQYLHQLWRDAIDMETEQSLLTGHTTEDERRDHALAIKNIKIRMRGHLGLTNKIFIPHLDLSSIK
jgi:hypothetical protein